MVDRDKIESLIRYLQHYTQVLREIAQMDQGQFLREPVTIGGARYYLQVAIETTYIGRSMIGCCTRASGLS